MKRNSPALDLNPVCGPLLVLVRGTAGLAGPPLTTMPTPGPHQSSTPCVSRVWLRQRRWQIGPICQLTVVRLGSVTLRRLCWSLRVGPHPSRSIRSELLIAPPRSLRGWSGGNCLRVYVWCYLSHASLPLSLTRKLPTIPAILVARGSGAPLL
jgi:hypothetical protein